MAQNYIQDFAQELDGFLFNFTIFAQDVGKGEVDDCKTADAVVLIHLPQVENKNIYKSSF